MLFSLLFSVPLPRLLSPFIPHVIFTSFQHHLSHLFISLFISSSHLLSSFCSPLINPSLLTSIFLNLSSPAFSSQPFPHHPFHLSLLISWPLFGHLSLTLHPLPASPSTFYLLPSLLIPSHITPSTFLFSSLILSLFASS